MDHLQQLRNLKDFLLVYNRMTEICFQRCTTNFNYRALTMDEERCVDSCAGKLIRSNHRLMGTYVQLMPKMMQRRMDELESKAAEVAKAEAAQAASAGVEQAAVSTVPDPAATDVPVSILSPDTAAPVTTVDAPQLPLSVPEVTGAVPDLSSASPPAADMPVMNGPSLTNAVGNSALLFAPPPPLPEVSGAVGLVTGLTEIPVIPSEASVAVPIAVEGPSTHMSLPSVTEFPAQGSVLSTSGEKMIPSPLELPSTVPPTQPVTIPSIESKIVVPDLPKATSDATAPIVVPVLKPSIESKIVVPDLTKASSDATASILAPVTNGVPVTSTSTSTAASTSEGSQSSS